MSTVQFSRTHTSDIQRPAPQAVTTRDDLKTFLIRLGERHSRFCDSCRTLVAESLNFLEENDDAGSTGRQPTEHGSRIADTGDGLNPHVY